MILWGSVPTPDWTSPIIEVLEAIWEFGMELTAFRCPLSQSYFHH